LNRKTEIDEKVVRLRSERRNASAQKAKNLSAAILQYLLVSLEIKQTEVREALGLSRHSIWRIRKAERILRISDIVILANAAGMTIHELIEKAGHEPEGLQPEFKILKETLKSSPGSDKLK